MRILFLLLVLANAVFYAYAFVARERAGADNQIPLLQISPEKIKLISSIAGMGAAQRKPAVARPQASAAPAACLEWGVFAGPEVARADAVVAGLGFPEAQVMRTVVDAGGYWVYIPPLKSKSEVDKKIGELKGLGVEDFFPVQEATPWRNAISLGIFKTDDAAKNRLAELRGKGVRSAVAERRENFLKQIAYYVREPGEATVAKLAELQREFPGTQIKAVACPPAAQPQG